MISDKIMELIELSILGRKTKLFKDVYNTKVIKSEGNGSIHFSCRFYNSKKEYFIFSLCISLNKDSEYYYWIISKLDDRRFYFNTIKFVKQGLPISYTLRDSLKKDNIKNYINSYGKLPTSLLMNVFDKLIKNNTILSLNKLEGNNNGQ